MQKLNKIGLIAKHSVIQKNTACLNQLVALLKKHDAEIIFDEVTGPFFKKKGLTRTQVLNRSDLVIVMGGDGTLLKTARHLTPKSTLILGVNMGNVGFLTSVAPKQLPKAIHDLFKGNYDVDERNILRVTVYRKGKKVHTTMALNEAVINQGGFARLINLVVTVNNRNLSTYRADGLIVATPTGSTGHSLSAGGPIIHPKIPAMIITPLCPVRLSVRPIVIPADRQIAIEVKTEWLEEKKPIVLTVDGQETFNLHKDDVIKIRRSSRNMQIIRVKGNNYYKMLQKKLSWGE